MNDIINMFSDELAQRVVKVKRVSQTGKNIVEFLMLFKYKNTKARR